MAKISVNIGKFLLRNYGVFNCKDYVLLEKMCSLVVLCRRLNNGLCTG
jgi:hypothetical protein